MNPRTIRQLPRRGSDDLDLDLVHKARKARKVRKVRMAKGRGYNGTYYYAYCNLRLSSGEKWAAPQHTFVNCVRCLEDG